MPTQQEEVPLSTAGQEKINFDTLMRGNLFRVFGERDRGRRRAALDELYATDATLYEPEGVFTGRDAINGAVDALISSLTPEFVFTPVGNGVGHHGPPAVPVRQPAQPRTDDGREQRHRFGQGRQGVRRADDPDHGP